ncbi:MAG: response regulator transcription factor [Chloroflexi bacterium]|nr:response regulator transcription factor [Chloroflexota bacterium]
MSAIRVMLADDHRLFRQGLRQICELKGGCEVVAEAENGQQAIELALRLRPDVILMDIQMPVLDGVQAARQIMAQNSAARIIILTMYQQDNYVFEAVKAGVRGYLLKDADWPDVIAAIQAVQRGEAIINSGLAMRVLDEFRRLGQAQNTSPDFDALTPGEMDVLRLVAQGEENKVIADRLGLTERTIANRLSEVYQKLHVNNRTQATLIALRRGWAQLDQTD